MADTQALLGVPLPSRLSAVQVRQPLGCALLQPRTCCCTIVRIHSHATSVSRLPSFPGKSYNPITHKAPSFIETRAGELALWLQSLCVYKEIIANPSFIDWMEMPQEVTRALFMPCMRPTRIARARCRRHFVCPGRSHDSRALGLGARQCATHGRESVKSPVRWRLHHSQLTAFVREEQDGALLSRRHQGGE